MIQSVSLKIVLVFALVLGAYASIAAAQGTSTEAVPENAARGEMREARMEAKEERRVALQKQLQDRIVNLASNVTNRLNAATGRMENIIGRLDSRITKLKAVGVDTESAEAKLVEAKNALAETKVKLATLGSVHAAVTGETPRESYIVIRAEFLAVRDGIKQTHALLRETVTLLKDAVRNTPETNGVSDAVSNATTTSANQQ